MGPEAELIKQSPWHTPCTPLAHHCPDSALASHQGAELTEVLPCGKLLSPLKGCCPFLTPYPTLNNCLGCWNLEMVSLHNPYTWPLSQSHHKEQQESWSHHLTGHYHWAGAKGRLKRRSGIRPARTGVGVWEGQGTPAEVPPALPPAPAFPHSSVLKVTLSHLPSNNRLRHKYSKAQLFLKAKIHPDWQDFIKKKQPNYY